MRRVIGWLLFALGILLFFPGATISKEIMGSLIPGMFIAGLVIGAGWILAHPKH